MKVMHDPGNFFPPAMPLIASHSAKLEEIKIKFITACSAARWRRHGINYTGRIAR